MPKLSKIIHLAIFLFCGLGYIHAQVRVIDHKGTFKQIDSSKWTLSGTHIYNKNSGNVGIGLINPMAKLHTSGTLRFEGLPLGLVSDSCLQYLEEMLGRFHLMDSGGLGATTLHQGQHWAALMLTYLSYHGGKWGYYSKTMPMSCLG
ncbi:MAG: hypothetical protein IPJ13_11090 [Saprospiraceae bacterium]|nr:hypothetical protein [Saprospiraceae bacterium]